ncbi:hypothetical protein KY284_006593 [Solanum tuberosum]|nr:hypothetical protein KY284_006593 [Solanum tuberosum]
MEEIIFTNIYHGGILSEVSVPTYVGNCVPALKYIIKDHFSILELLYYTKELGYETVGGFYAKDLLNEPLLDIKGPIGYITNDSGEGEAVDLGGQCEVVNLSGESVDVNLGEGGEVVNLGDEGEVVSLGGEGVDDNLGGEGVDDNLGGEGESDFLSSDSNLGDGSEDEIPVGEAGGIDRGFEDIGKNKTNKYVGKLGRDEDYPDSSDCWSDDSDEQVDVDVVRGVDIPARRRSKKVRYDEDCEVSIFELGMVFDGANKFRNAVADYAVEYKRQIKSPQKKVQVGTGRVLGRKTTNARGTPFVTERDNSSSHLPPLSGHKRPYSFASFAAATGGNRRPTTSFGVYSDRTTGAQVFNLGTSSEKILHGPTKLKSASPTNIDIGFKPRGLKWKGKDAVSTSQLHQMKANKKKKGSCGTSEK